MAGIFFGIGFGTTIGAVLTALIFSLDPSTLTLFLVMCCAIMIAGIGMRVFEK